MSVQNNYQSISGADDDIEPVDKIISKRAKTSFRHVIATCILIVLVAASVVLWFRYEGRRPIRLYETSQEQKVMRQITSNDLAFGNTQCQYDDVSAKYTCSNINNPPATIHLDDKEVFQEVLGFGGAFTEASAVNFYKLPPDVQDKVIELYFGKDGIGFTVGRVHINSCDFALESYSFDNIDGDFDLTYFDTEVTHDNAFLLPFIRRAIAASDRSMKLIASPWSPPAWMKVPVEVKNLTRGTSEFVSSMTGSAWPNGLINTPQVKEAWARYISKWITAYNSKGVSVWSVTPQNEPEFAAPWDACLHTADFQKDFIDHYLGPVLHSEHPDVLILGFDHNKDHLVAWTETLIVQQEESKKRHEKKKHDYVDGMAFHWYSGGARVEDGTYGYDAVNASHHLAPEALLLSTEGCSCPGVELGNWLRAERLAHDVMFDLQNYAQGWVDWNLLLNHEGGPNHLGNLCDAPLVTNEDYSDIVVQPKFHYFAHFSKFVPPGARRIKSTAVGNFEFASMDPNIQAGVELGMYGCERSVRQMWSFGAESKTSTVKGRVLQLTTAALTMDQAYDGTVRLCVARSNRLPRTALRLADCTDPVAEFPTLKLTSLGQMVDTNTSLCLSFIGDVREPGALLELATCETVIEGPSTEPVQGASDARAADHQLFALSASTGEITSPKVDHAMCLTAGWPFLNAVAFSTTPTGKDNAFATSVVVMNEAAVATPLVVMHKGEYLGLSIAARAMQTLLF